MRSATVRLDDLRTTVLNLGYVGENEHTQIRIDSKKMFEQYPTASPSLTVSPPEGESYPAVIERDGDIVIWTITDSDLIHEGSGEIQLSFTVSEVVAKSYIGRFRVSRSIMPTGEIPEGIDDFLTRAGAALTAIPETIDEALAEAKASGEFDGPAGPAGQDGTDGQDGFSPTATVVKSGKVATITITDKNGTTTAQISDGEGGGTGDYSDLTNKPQIAGVTLTGNVSLHDLGAAAESDIPVLTSLIDDTAGDGDTDKVWSADKSASLLSDLSVLEPTASASDVGKFLKAKTVSNGKVTEYEFGEGGGSVDPSVIAEAVDDWLDEHPEAVTTVQDGAVTEPKLADSLKQRIMTFIPLNGWSTVNYDSGYIGASGNVGSNASFRHTDYIPVSQGDEIAYNLSGYETTIYIVTGYNSSKEKVTGADVVGKTGFKSGTYTVPSGVAYVRLSSGSYSDANLYFRSATVLGTNPQNTQTYIDNADNALSERITANANELEELDGVESVKSFYTMSPNLIDPSKTTPYGMTGYVYCDYIPVEEGERYTINANDNVYEMHWYDSTKTQISYMVLNCKGYEAKAPTNAAYIRLAWNKNNITKIMLAHGVVGDYVPYGILIEKETLPTYIKRDTNNINNPNVFVKDVNVNSNSGAVSAYSGTCVTDFIPVDEGATYYIGGEADGTANMTGGASFNSSYQYVGSVSFPYTVPSGVAYIRIGYTPKNNTYASPCIRKGQTGISGIQKFNPYDTFQIINSKPTAYEQANGLYGLKWNCMGDSITEGSGTTKSYAGFIAQRTGILPTNYGVSNTAIAKTNASDAYAMSVRYTDMTNDADIVTVFGGTNDHGNSIPIGEWGDSTALTVYGAMKILCEGLISKYMGKKIGFILPLPKYVSSTDYSYPNASFGAYIDCIKDVCKRYSIPYLDLYTECGFAPKIEAVRTAMIQDGLHPNATGHELISWQIQRFLERL